MENLTDFVNGTNTVCNFLRREKFFSSLFKEIYKKNDLLFFFFFNWHSLHARLNSHQEAWSYKKKKHKKIRTHRKSV